MKSTLQLGNPGQYSRGLGIALIALFSLLSLWALVRLAATIISPPGPALSANAPGVEQPAAGGVESGAPIAQWHLFGDAAPVAATPADAPVSAAHHADLVLHGTLTANDPDRARAIIADRHGAERAYRIGEALPGDVILGQIFPDHVVLRGPLGDEMLFLPRVEQVPAPVSPAAPPSRQTITADASALRDQLLSNPTLLAEAVVPMPVWQSNECKGYRFRPGKDGAFMKQVGLLSTDVVSEVNGISLCSDGVLDALQSLAVADRVTVSILRNGQMVDLEVRLKQ